jgi:hypothetical protein
VQRRWFEERVLVPADALLRSLPVGEVAHGADGTDEVAAAVEALLRTEVAPTWPGMATTDGSEVHAWGRPAPGTLVAVGATIADFGPSAFPIRIRAVPDRQRVVIEVGDADPTTGVPALIDRPILLLADGDAAMEAVDVIDGRRQRRVTWSVVLDIGPEDLEG